MFKSLTCDTTPHFTSIASFISSHPEAIEDIFTQILMVCDEEGLIGHELIAIDGCKISSGAAKEHSGAFDELARKRDKIQQQIKACRRSTRDSIGVEKAKVQSGNFDILLSTELFLNWA